jgi:hypothetical protein
VIPEYRRGVTLRPPAADDVERDTRRRAVLAVCAHAVDSHDAEDVMDVLGLDPREGRPTEPRPKMMITERNTST